MDVFVPITGGERVAPQVRVVEGAPWLASNRLQGARFVDRNTSIQAPCQIRRTVFV
jgi:hypothetical protein